MKIGILKETQLGELRVAITPNVAKKLIKKGFSIVIESNAGQLAHFYNQDYSSVGVEIVNREIALNSDIILALNKPSIEDSKIMRAGSIFIGHLKFCKTDEIVSAMLHKGVIPLAMEQMPRISRAQPMDSLSSQSNITGYRAVIEAATHYRSFFSLMMTSAGSVKPPRVIILGTGVAGLQAIATARRLGADVYAYDIRPETHEQIESLGAKVIKVKGEEHLAEELTKANIIISTVVIPCKPAPILIPIEVVQSMINGSVIIDLAAINGGNCPLTKVNKVIVKYGVVLVGYTNFPSMLSSDASTFYANNLFNLINIMVNNTMPPKLNNLNNDEITKALLIHV